MAKTPDPINPWSSCSGNAWSFSRDWHTCWSASPVKSNTKMLLVVTQVYRQQHSLAGNNQQSIEDRIVSLSQPHLRPIIRGKAGKPVEFGVKISASYFDGYVFLERLSWDNFNESKDLKSQVEAYYKFTGYYPQSVHVDRIYQTRENRAWCKERGIRISGPPFVDHQLMSVHKKRNKLELMRKFAIPLRESLGKPNEDLA